MHNLILLHGALGSNAQWAPLVPLLETHYSVHCMEFEGHGATPSLHNEFRIEHFADQLNDYIINNTLAPARIFGYSMGGYVALYLAKQNAAAIDRVMTLATKFAWSPEAACRETKFLEPDVIAQKVPAFAAELEQRHTAIGWRAVLERTAAMMTRLGNSPTLNDTDLTAIQHPVCIAIGDRDTMVSVDESTRASQQLPHGILRIFHDMVHPLEKVDPQILAAAIIDFLAQ